MFAVIMMLRALLVIFLTVSSSVSSVKVRKQTRRGGKRPLGIHVDAVKALKCLGPMTQSALIQKCIQVNTAAEYCLHIQMFEQWFMEVVRPLPTSQLEVDLLILHYFETMVSEGGPPSIGSKTLASILHLWPQAGSTMRLAFPISYRGLRGWYRSMPPRTRQPLPLLGIFAIVGLLLFKNLICMSLAVMVGLECYLRPRELTSLNVAQLVAPQLHGGHHFKWWALILSPFEGLVPTKSGKFDDSILINGMWLRWATDFFAALTKGRAGTTPLWPFTHSDLVKEFRDCCRTLNLQGCLYQLRHSGASADLLSEFRPRSEIQDRGRWAAVTSLNRYAKASRAQAELGKLEPQVIKLGQFIQQNLSKVFSNPFLIPIHMSELLITLPAKG